MSEDAAIHQPLTMKRLRAHLGRRKMAIHGRIRGVEKMWSICHHGSERQGYDIQYRFIWFTQMTLIYVENLAAEISKDGFCCCVFGGDFFSFAKVMACDLHVYGFRYIGCCEVTIWTEKDQRNSGLVG